MTEREQLIQTLVASRRLGLAPLWVALLPRTLVDRSRGYRLFGVSIPVCRRWHGRLAGGLGASCAVVPVSYCGMFELGNVR